METWRHGDMKTWRHGDMETWRQGDMETLNGKQKTEAQAIFLDPFTICSSYKQKFVVSPFVEEETYKNYMFAIEVNGLNGLNVFTNISVLL
jgi:hypothetical protein